MSFKSASLGLLLTAITLATGQETQPGGSPTQANPKKGTGTKIAKGQTSKAPAGEGAVTAGARGTPKISPPKPASTPRLGTVPAPIDLTWLYVAIGAVAGVSVGFGVWGVLSGRATRRHMESLADSGATKSAGATATQLAELVDGRLAGLEAHLDELKLEIANRQQPVSAFPALVDIEEAFGRQSEKLQRELDGRFAGVPEGVRLGLAADKEELKHEVGTLGDLIVPIDEKLNAVRGDVATKASELAQLVQGLEAKLAALDAQSNELLRRTPWMMDLPQELPQRVAKLGEVIHDLGENCEAISPDGAFVAQCANEIKAIADLLGQVENQGSGWKPDGQWLRSGGLIASIFHPLRSIHLHEVSETKATLFASVQREIDDVRRGVKAMLAERFALREIEVIPFKTVFDERLHHDNQPFRRTPPEPELACVVFERLQPGFQQGDEVLQQAFVNRFVG